MSTVATFTVRDLSRRTAELLDAVRKYGVIEISARTGEVFTIASKKKKQKARKHADLTAEFLRKSEERAQRFREMGFIPPPASEMERINRIIAGEE
jgi:prevent-host-death family protein